MRARTTEAQPGRDPIAEASVALADITFAVADQFAATDRLIEARHRLAAALARIAHPLPSLRVVTDGNQK